MGRHRCRVRSVVVVSTADALAIRRLRPRSNGFLVEVLDAFAEVAAALLLPESAGRTDEMKITPRSVR